MKAGSTGTAGIEIALLILSAANANAQPGSGHSAGQPAGTVIPAISGTVVDAITGRPVAAVDVTLRVRASRGRSLRYENARTSPLGRFSFPSSVGPEAEFFSSGVDEIAITVNIPFVSLDRLRASAGNNEVDSDLGSDASVFLSRDPLFTAKSTRLRNMSLRGPRVGNKSYFPLAVQFLKACQQLWNANCITMETTRDIRVPLVPVLDNAAACKRILDPDVSEDCRQLQTYRSAFRQIETMAQLQAAKEICNSIDHGGASHLCLESLHAYILRPMDFDDRPPLRMDFASAEEALIVAPIAGLQVVSHTRADADPFAGTALYFATYQRESRPISMNSVQVRIEVAGDAGALRARFALMLKATHGRFEMFDGSPMVRFEDERSSSVAWLSKDAIVTVAANHMTANELRNSLEMLGERATHATDLTPGMSREVIRSYLRKYPASN